MTGFIINMTKLVQNIEEKNPILNTEFVINMAVFVLNMAVFLMTVTPFEVSKTGFVPSVTGRS